jgi:O-antigen/teichoic acid export membrane protein
LFSSQILGFFLGNEGEHAVLFLRVLCIALVISSLQIPGYLVLVGGNHKKNYLAVFTVATILNIAVHALLAGFFEARGTVAAVVLTEFFIAAGLSSSVYNLYISKESGNLAQKHL